MAFLLGMSYLAAATTIKNMIDPLIGISPTDCYSCKSKYPDYSFCNINDTFGACCPEFSTDEVCMTSSANSISCSEDDSNHDFYYSHCVVKNS